MGANSAIAWTDHTFNPWRGCTKIASGCANCYAKAMSKRNPKLLGVWGDKGTRVVASETMWKQPLKWAKEARTRSVSDLFGPGLDVLAPKIRGRPRVFCASLADVFEDRHDLDAPRTRLMQLITDTPGLDWLLLTKRPQNASLFHPWDKDGFPPNVWLGYSVAEQKDVANIDVFLLTRARTHFLSVEPLVGGIQIPPYTLYRGGVDWIITGGESGPGARPCSVGWIRSIVHRCREAAVPCFVKQLGANRVGEFGADDGCWLPGVTSRAGSDPSEWPEDLRVQQWPACAQAKEE